MVFESLYPASAVLDERGRPVRHIPSHLRSFQDNAAAKNPSLLSGVTTRTEARANPAMSRAFLVRSFSRCVRRLARWLARRQAGGRRSRDVTLRDAAPDEWHGCLHQMHNDITPSPVSAAEGQVNFNSPCSVVNSSSHFKAFCCQL